MSAQQHSAAPLRCLIVDDDEVSRLALERLVETTDSLTLVGCCSSPVEALRVLQRNSIDLLFLDVEMPELTGLDLARSLAARPEIILVTAREHYAVEAFEAEVADYIVKPVTLQRFARAVNRVLERRRAAGISWSGDSAKESIYVKVRTQLVKIPTADILWIESNGDYVTIHTEGGKYTAHATMKEMEAKLPAGFVRVHRSYLVHIEKIKAIEETMIVIGGSLIPIGDKYRAALMKQLNLV